MKVWWLSFADGTRPRGMQFLGVVIVRAHSFIEAIRVSHHLGINPGGEVRGFVLDHPPAKKWMDRLLSQTEAETCRPERLDKRGKA